MQTAEKQQTKTASETDVMVIIQVSAAWLESRNRDTEEKNQCDYFGRKQTLCVCMFPQTSEA